MGSFLDMFCCCESWIQKGLQSDSSTEIVPLQVISLPTTTANVRGVKRSKESPHEPAIELPKHLRLPPKRSLEMKKYKIDIGQIQQELYFTEANQIKYTSPLPPSSKHQKGEVTEECFGTILFSVKNDQSRFIVYLNKIMDLPFKGGPTIETEMMYDVVIQAFLLPDERPLARSKVVQNTQNPVFHDTLVVPCDTSLSLDNVSLRMSVYWSESCLPHKVIGHVVVALADCGYFGCEKQFVMRLSRRSQVTGDLGAILISLAYLPSSERLSAVIIRAKDLKGEKGVNTDVDTYVKVTLQCKGENIKTRRTAVVHGTSSPVYTDSLAFVVPMALIDQTCLTIQVAQKTHFKRDPILGQLVLGPLIYTTGNNLSHWGKMLNSREATRQWHFLYM